MILDHDQDPHKHQARRSLRGWTKKTNRMTAARALAPSRDPGQRPRVNSDRKNPPWLGFSSVTTNLVFALIILPGMRPPRTIGSIPRWNRIFAKTSLNRFSASPRTPHLGGCCWRFQLGHPSFGVSKKQTWKSCWTNQKPQPNLTIDFKQGRALSSCLRHCLSANRVMILFTAHRPWLKSSAHEMSLFVGRIPVASESWSKIIFQVDLVSQLIEGESVKAPYYWTLHQHLRNPIRTSIMMVQKQQRSHA